MTAAIVIATLLFLLGVIAWALKQKYPHNEDRVVTAIDALLPQTQCAQCGYPGCRPYAQALARSEAATNLCPPGGSALFTALNDLLHPDTAVKPPSQTASLLAVIEETACIGCALCLPPCPVDAIVGAAGQMHTVIEAQCTGCELCVPACPVDCISLVDVPSQIIEIPSSDDLALGCIACGQCDDSCPLDLPAQSLLSAVQNKDQLLVNNLGISRCIECGLCDKACPSSIPLAEIFAAEKRQQLRRVEDATNKALLKARYATHTERLGKTASEQSDRRADRLKGSRPWQ